LSNTYGFRGSQQAKSELAEESKRLREKRKKSLEEKTKIFEENARVAKLSIDKQLLVQILQEEKRSHNDAIRELEEALEEEKRSHNDSVGELEEKIAVLEQQMKSLSKAESIHETPSEPEEEVSESAQEISEPAEETSTDVDERTQRARRVQESVYALLQESTQSESEVPLEAPKKKKRGFF
jgi:uncharacterized phage infection (PIP) family protein YhgE